MRLTGLTCPDGFVSPQYVAEAVDTTGMVFEAEYSDGTTASVSPQSLSPSTWGNTAGTQTCTFTYTEDGVSASCEVEATVEERQPAGFVVSGTMPAQYVNRNVDTTGLSYTYNGVAVDPSDVTVSPASWTTSGNAQTVTFTYDGNTVTETVDVARTVASLPVTHTSSIPVDTARSADLEEIFENVVGADIDPQGTSDWVFVIDVQGGTFAPVSLNAGDCVLWTQDKSAFDLDQANGCDATYVGTAMQLYGIDGSSLSFGPGPDLATEFSDFAINMPMTGTYTATADTEVCWVFAKANSYVADATTLKPSDVDLVAVWDVTYTVPALPEVTSLDVQGRCSGTNQIGGSESYSGLSFVFGLNDGTSVTKSWSQVQADPTLIATESDWLEGGSWAAHNGNLTAQVTFTPGTYWTDNGYVIDPNASDTRAIGLIPVATPTSIDITADDPNAIFPDDYPAQYIGFAPDLTGYTVTATINGDTYDITDNPAMTFIIDNAGVPGQGSSYERTYWKDRGTGYDGGDGTVTLLWCVYDGVTSTTSAQFIPPVRGELIDLIVHPSSSGAYAGAGDNPDVYVTTGEELATGFDYWRGPEDEHTWDDRSRLSLVAKYAYDRDAGASSSSSEKSIISSSQEAWITYFGDTPEVVTSPDIMDGYDPIPSAVTFSYTENSVTKTRTINLIEPPVPPHLEVSGTLTNTQIVGQAPDITGLSFALVSGESSTPISASDIVVKAGEQAYGQSGNVYPKGYQVWPAASAGTSSMYFSYTDPVSGTSYNASMSNVTVTGTPDEVTSLTISGTCTGNNVVGGYADYTGLTFTFGLASGGTFVKTGAEYMADQDATDWNFTYCNDTSDWIDENWQWQEYQGSLNATVNFEVNSDQYSSFLNFAGYTVASPAPTAQASVTISQA